MKARSLSLHDVIRKIIPADQGWRGRARDRILRLTMPPWALGRLLDLAVDLAGMTRSLAPPVDRRAVVVMAGDHGVTEEGVSAFPREVTVQMVRNFARGGAAVNVLAGAAGARVIVVDVGVAGDLGDLAASGKIISRRVAPGTRNFLRGPAMGREEAIRALEVGIETAFDLADSVDLLAAGEMGIGNTTPSSAILCAFCGIDPEAAAGRGTGLDEEGRRRKAGLIARAIELHRPDPADPIGVLEKVGGFEIGAIAGLILGGAARRKPVLVDGFITTAGALLAQAICPAATDYMIASHRSAEPGHEAALRKIGKIPLLDLGMRLGEGTGAVLAMHLVDAAVRVLTRMATFDEAGVSGGNG